MREKRVVRPDDGAWRMLTLVLEGSFRNQSGAGDRNWDHYSEDPVPVALGIEVL